MGQQEFLSEGSLDIIIEQLNDRLHPIVQILGTKVMANSRIRAVIFDGQTMCQHCIFVSEELDEWYHADKLTKFTIIRIESYTVSSLPKKENIPVILVNQATILKPGEEIGHKFETGESFFINSGSSATENKPSTSHASMPNRMAAPLAPVQNVTLPSGTFKPEQTCPINVLTPFYNAWVLRARVINKAQVRTYSNKKGDGKLFSFDVADESGEIRVTAFNAECDRFSALIEKGQTYYISKGAIKPANKRFSSLNNDYEITLTNTSIIESCNDAPVASTKIHYKFVNLAELNNLSAGSTVDVIGVIRTVSPPEVIISKKTSRELTKREVSLVDKSLAEVRLTLWNETANDFVAEPGQVMALRGATVGEFKGKTLSTTSSTMIEFDPEIPETHTLNTWYLSTGTNENFASLSRGSESGGISERTRFIAMITPKLLSVGETTNTYSNVHATIETTNRISNHLYKACGNNGCNKKVTDDNNGLYYCTKCERTSPTFSWRSMISLHLEDVSGNCWVTLFQENAEKLLGMSTAEVAELNETNPTEYSALINSLRFKDYSFRLMSRIEQYNNDERIRHTVANLFPVKPADRAQQIMRSIDVLEAQLAA